MTERLRAPGARAPATARLRGASLVGLMVGLAIGLFSLLVIAQVLAGSQAHRRAVMGAADAQQAGALAAWRLTRELRMAGELGCLGQARLITARRARAQC